MTERISELFDYGDEIVVDGLDNPFDPAEIQELTMRKLKYEPTKHTIPVNVRRVSRSLLLAAVFSTLFITSALAVGLSVHSRRQSQLSGTLAQGGTVAGYTEYAVPAEDDACGVTLLSALSDGSFERVWLNVSPVEEDEVPRFMDGTQTGSGTLWYDIGVRVPGDETIHGRAEYLDMLAFAPGELAEGPVLDRQALEQRYREQFYDPETKTLTVSLLFPQDELTVGRETELALSLVRLFEAEGRSEPITWSEEGELVRDFGTVRFTPVAAESLVFRFPEALGFENPETGGYGEIRGIELTASGVNTLVWHEDLELVYESDSARIAEGQTERALSWTNAEEQAIAANITLRLSDGSKASPVPTVAVQRENGEEKLISSGRTELWDIHEVVSVSVGDKTWEIPGHN